MFGFDSFQTITKEKVQTYGKSIVTIKGTVRCNIGNTLVAPQIIPSLNVTKLNNVITLSMLLVILRIHVIST